MVTPLITSAVTHDLVANTLGDEEYYTNILQRITTLCGDTCDMDAYFQDKKSNPACQTLVHEPLFHQSAIRWPPPPVIPLVLLPAYPMNGRIRIKECYFHDRTAGADAFWTEDCINDRCMAIANGTWYGSCSSPDAVRAVREAIKEANVMGKHIVVVGPTTPWVGCLLLNEGARHATTLEYGPVLSSHLKLSASRPYSICAMGRNGTLSKFDGMATFSSLEHSRLGRYGGLLNPFGDAIGIATIWCLCKANAFMVLGISSARAGAYGQDGDHVYWNAHRVYIQ